MGYRNQPGERRGGQDEGNNHEEGVDNNTRAKRVIMKTKNPERCNLINRDSAINKNLKLKALYFQ